MIYAKDNVPELLSQLLRHQSGRRLSQQAGLNASRGRERRSGALSRPGALAVDSDITDSVTAGMRLVTGNTSDLVSETQTLDGTAPYAFGARRALHPLRRAQRAEISLAVGGGRQVPESVRHAHGSDLSQGFDVRGRRRTGRSGLGDGSAEQSHVFITLGAHPLQEIELSPQDKWLAAAQLGANLRLRRRAAAACIDGGFFDYFNVTGRLNPLDGTLYNYTAPQFLRQGNTYFNIANSHQSRRPAVRARLEVSGSPNVNFDLSAAARARSCSGPRRMRSGTSATTPPRCRRIRPIRRAAHQGLSGRAQLRHADGADARRLARPASAIDICSAMR